MNRGKYFYSGFFHSLQKKRDCFNKLLTAVDLNLCKTIVAFTNCPFVFAWGGGLGNIFGTYFYRQFSSFVAVNPHCYRVIYTNVQYLCSIIFYYRWLGNTKFFC